MLFKHIKIFESFKQLKYSIGEIVMITKGGYYHNKIGEIVPNDSSMKDFKIKLLQHGKNENIYIYLNRGDFEKTNRKALNNYNIGEKVHYIVRTHNNSFIKINAKVIKIDNKGRIYLNTGQVFDNKGEYIYNKHNPKIFTKLKRGE